MAQRPGKRKVAPEAEVEEGWAAKVAPLGPLLLMVTAGALFRAVLAGTTDLYTDEAYYWTWAQRPALGYFDHPPLIAWLIALLGTRPAGLACGLLTMAAVYGFAADVHRSREAGLRAAALFGAAPGLVLVGTLATPDAPLLLAWALALWLLHRGRWATAGAAVGLAFLSKYTGALLVAVGALHWLLSSRRTWGWALGAVGAALVVAAPPLVWNAQHHWVSLGFQFRHGLGGDKPGLGSFLEFVGGQLLMAGPVLAAWTAMWAVRGPPEQRLLRWAAGLPLALFALASLRSRGEPNWPLVAYVPACVGLARAAPALRRAVWGTGAVLCAAGLFLIVWPVGAFPGDASLARLHGWSGLSSLVPGDEGHLPTPGGADRAAVFAPNYQLASEAAYYTRRPVGVLGATRPSQYDFWPKPAVPEGGSALWLSEDSAVAPPRELASLFEEVEGPKVLETHYAGRTMHRFQVWTLRKRSPQQLGVLAKTAEDR